ncbi:hypothetical protein AXG93_3121s1000 [Marchantia polymorpha subsp. ruderalis]|uniref:Uncharacterized protein n=1 Tax=Marchantia polymorpha subsp. ruderalis TaxID=1480154 RepID=A0A176VMW8_MARPO|nr:hypothetical protein AXG93_3121s1000 [Marchantia polymorpha subsp. ruderalis]
MDDIVGAEVVQVNDLVITNTFDDLVVDWDGFTQSGLRNYAVEIDAWRCHWSPNYMFITHGGVGTSGDVCGVVASGAASSSTSEGTKSGSTGEVVGKVLRAVLVEQLVEVS